MQLNETSMREYINQFEKFPNVFGDGLIKDSKGILDPVSMFPYLAKIAEHYDGQLSEIDIYADNTTHSAYDANGWLKPVYSVPNLHGQFRRYLKISDGNMYIKFLRIFEDGNEHNYEDCWKQCLAPHGKRMGNDIDVYKMLISTTMIKFSSKHERSKMYYAITPFGRHILSIVDSSFYAYRILRHFMKINDDNEACISMLQASLANPDARTDDDPEVVCKMLDEILLPDSTMHEHGIHATWCDRLIKALSKSKELVGIISNAEVAKHIEDSLSKSEAYVRFSKVLSKIQRKCNKKTA